MIEYIDNKSLSISVKLDGKIVGHIRKIYTANGKINLALNYQYLPKGQKIGGELFSSLKACKESLEKEGKWNKKS